MNKFAAALPYCLCTKIASLYIKHEPRIGRRTIYFNRFSMPHQNHHASNNFTPNTPYCKTDSALSSKQLLRAADGKDGGTNISFVGITTTRKT